MAVPVTKEYLAWDNVEKVNVTYNINGVAQRRKTIDHALNVSPRDRRSTFQGARTSAFQSTFWFPVDEFGDKEPDGNMLIERIETGEKYRSDSATLITLGNSKSHWDVLATRQQPEQ